jgi:hypothetical protein
MGRRWRGPCVFLTFASEALPRVTSWLGECHEGRLWRMLLGEVYLIRTKFTSAAELTATGSLEICLEAISRRIKRRKNR